MSDTYVMTTEQEPRQQPYTLSDLRKAADLTQKEVAARMGVTRSRVDHMEARYPNVRYSALLDYIKAVGGQLRVTGPLDVTVDHIGPDPSRERTRAYLDNVSKQGRDQQNPINIANWSARTKKLPLEQSQPQPGSDDTSR